MPQSSRGGVRKRRLIHAHVGRRPIAQYKPRPLSTFITITLQPQNNTKINVEDSPIKHKFYDEKPFWH